MKKRILIKNLTSGTIFCAIQSYFGPVQYAYGRISPTVTTATTDIATAIYEGTMASKNIGSASIASELEINNVDSKI